MDIVAKRLEGKVIALAGGAGGIGEATSLRLAREGAAVVVGDIDLPEAERIAAAIKGEGGQATAIRLDLGAGPDIETLVRTAVETYGGLDGFHVNAMDFSRINADTDPVDIDMAVYDHMMQVNLRGYFLCTRYAVPEIVKRGGGAMLYTSSGSAYSGDPTRVCYGMAKSAINALSRHVATRWGKDGVRSNVIAPGVVMHPKLEAAAGPQLTEWAMKRVKGLRLGAPADIAAMAALLLSDEGGYITGQVISIDGGSTMRA